MSTRPFTVFFDTYFYVWLASADDITASEVIAKLNELKVRHVLSTQVLVELLTNTNKPDKDISLFERVTRLEIPPLKVLRTTSVTKMDADGLSWNALLFDGDKRASLSTLFKSLHDAETIAESHTIVANKKLNTVQQEKLNKTLLPFNESIGLNNVDTGQNPPEKFLGFINQLFSNISHVLPQDQYEKLSQIDFNVPFTKENAENIAKQLHSVIGEEDLSWLKEGGKIIESATESDNRPFKVVTQQASHKEIKYLGNTIRDSANMLSFEKYKDQIDLLQLDAAQINLINRKGSRQHRFTEIRLADRCFCTNSLQATIDFIEKRLKDFSQ